MSRYRFDPQAFLLSSHDMDGIEFAALDTLQYGLAGDPEKAHCLVHREETTFVALILIFDTSKKVATQSVRNIPYNYRGVAVLPRRKYVMCWTTAHDSSGRY